MPLVLRELSPVVKRAPKDPTDRQGRQGAAQVASGSVLAGTGLLASGVPGVREPNALEVFNVRGSTKKQNRKLAASGLKHSDPRAHRSPVHPSNARHNARLVRSLPRGGILGFRANVHDGFIAQTSNQLKTGKGQDGKRLNLHDRGRLTGKLEAEHKIVRGMRIARRGFYGATIGGGALAADGIRRQKQTGSKPVRKRDSDRQRGPAVGAAGATVGGAAGAYAGLRWGADVPLALTNRRINREFQAKNGRPVAPGKVVVGGDTFERRLKAGSRGIKGGMALGATALGAGGYLAARGERVGKRAGERSDRYATAAVSGGLTTVGIGEAARRGLGRYERKYANRAKDSVLAAEKLAPHYGGLKVTPAKVNHEFGITTKPAKVTMYPDIPDHKLKADRADRKVHHKNRAEVARLRGAAAQERHFSEVFRSTGRGFARMRGPGTVVAAAGAGALAASSSTRRGQKRSGSVRKYDAMYGMQERRISPLRATEAAIGISLLGWGGSRLKIVQGTLKAGARRPGNSQINWKRAEKARQVIEEKTGRGAAMLGRQLNTGARLRPIEGAVGGALLTNHAIPIHRRKFTPMQAPTQQGGY